MASLYCFSLVFAGKFYVSITPSEARAYAKSNLKPVSEDSDL